MRSAQRCLRAFSPAAGHGPFHLSCIRGSYVAAGLSKVRCAVCRGEVNAKPVRVTQVDTQPFVEMENPDTAEDKAWLEDFEWGRQSRVRSRVRRPPPTFVRAAAAPDDPRDADYLPSSPPPE